MSLSQSDQTGGGPAAEKAGRRKRGHSQGDGQKTVIANGTLSEALKRFKPIGDSQIEKCEVCSENGGLSSLIQCESN